MSLPNINVLWWRVLLLLSVVAVTTLMWLPTSSLPQVTMWDKLQHGLVFVGLGWLSLQAFPRMLPKNILLALVMYGFVTELGQAFIPSRSFSVLDLVADAVGSLIVLVLPRLRRSD